MFNECRHIKTSGTRCHSPALRGMPFCYFHATIHRMADSKKTHANEPIQIPLLEDASAIQIALTRIVDAIGSARIDHRTAGQLLYALQIAVQVKTLRDKDDASDTVPEVCCEPDGEVLAPERSHCEPGNECDKCPVKHKCLNIKRINYRSVKKILSSWRDGQDQWEQKDRERKAYIKKHPALTRDVSSPKTPRDD